MLNANFNDPINSPQNASFLVHTDLLTASWSTRQCYTKSQQIWVSFWLIKLLLNSHVTSPELVP